MEYDKKNGDVAFRESKHLYFNLKDPSKQYVSVTTLIHRYTQPFNADFWSAYKSLEKLLPKDAWKIEKKSLLNTKKFNKEILDVYNVSENEFNRVQQQILDDWAEEGRKSCDRGTKIHAEIENSFYKQANNIELQKFGVGGKFECRKDYSELDLDYGVYPEYLVYRESEDGVLRIAGLIDLLIKSNNDLTLCDHKGLPLDTPILTSRGWKTIETLEIGDRVYDKDGFPCSVTAKSQVHHNPCYKINFDNSESLIADDEHLWRISFKCNKSKSHPDGYKHLIMTTVEIKKYLDTYEGVKLTNYIPKILNPEPILTYDKDFLIDPYILGVWLGDGSSDSGMITQAKGSPLWLEIEKRGYKLSDNLVHNPDREGTETRTIYNLRGKLKELNLIHNKHIPEEYMLGSYELRIDLLRGLMDTDGYYHPKRRRFVMNTSHKWQVYDLRKLLGTLGIKSTIFEVTNTCNGKKFKGWELCFTTHKFNPFLIRNLNITWENTLDKNTFRNIKSIESVESVPTQCIMVDSLSHTYLAGESLIVTHNTNKKIEQKSFYNSSTRQSVKMLYPLNTLDDVNYNHYCLQLSTYAWMLQKINPNFNIRDLIINHYDHEGNNVLYHCPYLKDEVERMLLDYRKNIVKDQSRANRKRIEY